MTREQTREKRIRVLVRAAKRRAGEDIPLDKDDGQSMVDQWLAGIAMERIARHHGVAVARAQRRLFSMGVYQALPAIRREGMGPGR